MISRSLNRVAIVAAGIFAITPLAYATKAALADQPVPATPQSAQATDAQQSTHQKKTQTLQTVQVTAEHRVSSINKTPITMDAFSAHELQQLHITDIKALARVSPSLNIHSPFGDNSYPALSIRGMNSDNFTEFSPQSIGVYLDGVYLTAPPMLGFSMFDLERVEVLKGPQGTLYGRNTIGGAIRLIPAPPTFTPDGYVNVTYGRYQHLSVEGAMGGPLSKDVAYRVSGRFVRQWEGPFNDSNPNGDSTGQVRQAYVRGQLLWNATPNFTTRIDVHAGIDHSDTWPFSQVAALVPKGQPNAGQICAPFLAGNYHLANAECVDVTGYHNLSNNPYRNPLSLFGRNHNKSFGTELHADWDLGFATLTSITGYEYLTRRAGYDEDAGPNPVIDTIRAADINQFSQELRLASKTDNGSRFSWLTGLYASHDRLSGSPIFVSNMEDWAGSSTADYDSLKTSVWGLFGQVNYKLTDKLKLTVGARESAVHRTFDYHEVNTPLVPVPGTPTVTFAAHNFLNQSAWSGKVGLDYTPTQNLMLYGSVSRGFNAGSFSPYFLGSPEAMEPTKPATDITYEAGFKWTTLQNRMQLNGALYYNDWKNIQVTAIENRAGINAPYLTNAQGAYIYGGELELKARPVPQWTLSLGTSYIHTALRNIINPNLFGVPVNLKGRPLANSPEWSVMANTAYQFTLRDNYHVVPSVDARWETKEYRDLLGTQMLVSPQHMIANASVTVDHGGPWHVEVWMHNITNRQYVTEAYQVVAAGMAGLVWNMPRTYGVTFGTTFP